jgi:ATP-dependent DNA helicase DinG
MPCLCAVSRYERIVCDPRMAGMNYGKRLRQALPPMTSVANEAQALAWLAELAGVAVIQ